MDERNSATLRRKQAGHLNVTEMAKLLGVNKYTFFYWVNRGLVPKPTITFTGRRRYYAPREVAKLREIVEGSGQ